jgi:hypothetical protein
MDKRRIWATVLALAAIGCGDSGAGGAGAGGAAMIEYSPVGATNA